MKLSGSILIALLLAGCGGARTPGLDSNNIGSVSSSSSLTWQAPSTFTDLSPLSLSDIGGYKIYVGANEGPLTFFTNINDPSITSFDLSRIGKGTHRIAVTCYDINGIESFFSSELTVNII